MSIRPIKRVVQSQPTLEGAGVKLRRAFGFGNTGDFDPFLLLDDFRTEHPLVDSLSVREMGLVSAGSSARRTKVGDFTAPCMRTVPHASSPTDHTPRYQTWLSTPLHASTCVMRQSEKIMRLCHIHNLPQFSNTSA